MRYKITLFFIVLFLCIYSVTNSTFNFGLIQSLNFVPKVINYFFERPYYMNNTVFTSGDLNYLFSGFIFYSLFACIFIILAISVRAYENENQNTTIKSIIAFFLLTISIFFIFSSMLNKIEYDKIETYKNLIKETSVIEVENNHNLSIDINDLIIIKNVYDYYKENTVLSIEMTYNKIELTALNIESIYDYKKVLRNKYKYKLKLKNEKNIKIKQTDVVVLEYELSGFYNLDYIIGVNKEIFVINFKFDEMNSENIGVVNDFFVNSFYIQRG